jgi:hypothetical protein
MSCLRAISSPDKSDLQVTFLQLALSKLEHPNEMFLLIYSNLTLTDNLQTKGQTWL